MALNEGLMVSSSRILEVATLLYVCLFFVHLVHLATKKEGALKAAWLVLYVAFGIHTLGIVARWVESYSLGIGHAPLSNYYESLVFFAWCIPLVVILMRRKLNVPAVNTLAALGSFLILAYASLSTGASSRSFRPFRAIGSTYTSLPASSHTRPSPFQASAGSCTCSTGRASSPPEKSWKR